MHFSLDVNPGDVSNNGRLIPSRGRLVDSPEYRNGLRMMAWQVRSQMNEHGWKQIAARCSVSAITYWPTEAGDVDATSKAILDCLQAGGAIVNDKQVRPLTLDRAKDKARPRVEITLTELVDG